MGSLIRVVRSPHPLHDVEVARAIERNGILVKEVGHHNKVAIGGKLVGDQLGVVEAVADHVGDAWDGEY